MRNPNGWGSVHKLPGNRRKPWRARVTVGWDVGNNEKGKQRYSTLGYFETREEAMLALAEYNANPYDINSAITFTELYEKWSENKFPTIDDSNVNGYKASYKVCGKLYNMRFNDIRLVHLQEVVDTCGKNYPTLRKLKVLFSQLYSYAMQNDICDKDYSDYVNIAKHKNRNAESKHKIFTSSEVDVIWNNSERSDYAGIMLMLIYSGLRISELLDLKKEDVYFEQRYFSVIDSKTDAGIRKVPIAEKVAHFWERWLKDEGEYVLHGPSGRKFSYSTYLKTYYKKPIEQMGLGVHYPHDARYTCISMLTSEHVPKMLIKRIVGHQGEDVTDNVYTHFEIQQLIDAINMI